MGRATVHAPKQRIVTREEGEKLWPASTKINRYEQIYILFIRHIPHPSTAGSACNNAKKRDKKEWRNNGSGQGETIHPNPGNWWAYGEENKTEGRIKEMASLLLLKSNPSRKPSKVLYRSRVRRRGKTGKYRKLGVKRKWWVSAQSPYSPQVTGRQLPRVEP